MSMKSQVYKNLHCNKYMYIIYTLHSLLLNKSYFTNLAREDDSASVNECANMVI
jgi:hypothetical protein